MRDDGTRHVTGPTRQLIVTAFVSLDGAVEAPGGEPGHRSSGWIVQDLEHDDAVYEIKGREQEEAGAMLLGRVTYQAFAPVWPDLDYFPHDNAMPRHVVSSTLGETDRGLADAGLVDRYHLLVFPVLLGAGKRLWSETDKDKQPLTVVESETYGNRAQLLVYDVRH